MTEWSDLPRTEFREAPTKLTSDQRRQILEAYAGGIALKIIAERHNVTVNYVTILARRNGIPRNRREQQQQKRVERMTKTFVGRIMQEARRKQD